VGGSVIDSAVAHFMSWKIISAWILGLAPRLYAVARFAG
jgi:hypothetical protein